MRHGDPASGVARNTKSVEALDCFVIPSLAGRLAMTNQGAANKRRHVGHYLKQERHPAFPQGAFWFPLAVQKIKPARPSRAGDKRAGSFRGHLCTLRCKSGYSCSRRPEKAEKRNRLNTGRLMSGIRIARKSRVTTLRLDVPRNLPTCMVVIRPQKIPRPDAPSAVFRGLAAFCAVLVWALGLLAASPELHAALHHDADQADHVCAVTLFHQGTENPVPPLVIAPAPLLTVVALVAPVDSFRFEAPDGWLQPAQGPPLR